MRDVEDRFAAPAQFGDDAVQPGDFGLRQGARRFIHDENFGVEEQRLCDLDELLIADSQRSDERAGVEVAVEFAEFLSRGGVHAALVEQTPAGQLAAEKQVGGDREVVDQIQLLMDDRDARGFRIARAVEAGGDAPNAELPLGLGVDA